jgi:hypothetical protein
MPFSIDRFASDVACRASTEHADSDEGHPGLSVRLPSSSPDGPLQGGSRGLLAWPGREGFHVSREFLKPYQGVRVRLQDRTGSGGGVQANSVVSVER